MSSDALPAAPSPSPTLRPGWHGARASSSAGRGWRRSLLAIGVVVVLTPMAALISHFRSSGEIGPRLTHTVTRGDLLISVATQGTLESSENSEIKCKVRGGNIPIIWIIENGTEVKPGDELVRLATLEFEDRVNEVMKWMHMTRSLAERSTADLANAQLAISEYLEGRYRSQLMTLEKDLAIAESSLLTAQNVFRHTDMMAARGYVSELDVEETTFAVTQAELNVKAEKTAIEILKTFTKAMELETLNGNLKATTARHEANKERAKLVAEQIVLCQGDLDNCVVRADRSGVVIYPTAEPWKHVPEIELGAAVYMGQTLLLMPNLSKMQVKLSIPESAVHRIQAGLAARVMLLGETLDGQVSSVASVTAPTSKWTGSIVTYDTIIKLPEGKIFKPGSSAEVELIIARYQDVLTIPVAAVVGTEAGNFCWVRTTQGTERRALELGDTNDVHVVVKSGVEEGDEVFLNPLAFEPAGTDVTKPLDKAGPPSPETVPSGAESTTKPASADPSEKALPGNSTR